MRRTHNGRLVAASYDLIALGARFSVVLGRLFNAARDVRDSLRSDSHGKPPAA